jgi:hypothetical protein
VHPGERLDARIRPDLGEGMIINPRHDRLSVDSELDHAGVVKCDFGEHSAAGASLDQHAPVQLTSWVSWTMVVASWRASGVRFALFSYSRRRYSLE